MPPIQYTEAVAAGDLDLFPRATGAEGDLREVLSLPRAGANESVASDATKRAALLTATVAKMGPSQVPDVVVAGDWEALIEWLKQTKLATRPSPAQPLFTMLGSIRARQADGSIPASEHEAAFVKELFDRC